MDVTSGCSPTIGRQSGCHRSSRLCSSPICATSTGWLRWPARIVGWHAGDGVTGFFLAETAGSESGAARSCIEAARAVQDVVVAAVERSDLHDESVTFRFGLHWGARLYVGQIQTAGRSEVAALGDEVNDAARIEACASGGRTLVSKDLRESLTVEDAEALAIDFRQTKYTVLAELPTATEKARRDAPAIAVCEV